MGARLNRIWRIVGTAASFALFGVGGLLFGLVVLPGVRLFVRDSETRKQRTQQIISLGFSLFIGFMRAVRVLDYEVEGLAHLQVPGRLVVANHPSLIDVVFLIAFMRQVDCVVKQHLWRNPVTAMAVRQAGYISNAGGRELTRRCAERIRAGNRLIIFPEGTRTVPGKALNLQRGAAHIALQAGADIVPVTIRLREATLTKGEPWYHVPSRKIQISIHVGTPFHTQDYLDAYDNMPTAARRLTADLSAYYSTRLGAVESSQQHHGD